MPPDLAALLIEGGVVSQADMDRAVARQADEGGALDTALLELGLIGERELVAALADASGLPVAPPASLDAIDPRARRVFPARVAERHRLAPLALDGRDLSVVACHPIDAAAIDEIGFMLSLTLVPHVAVEWRVHDLIHRLYGGQLPSRLARLADAARLMPPPEPVEPPPADEAAASGDPLPAEPEPTSPPAATVTGPASPLSIEEAFFAAGEAGNFAPASASPGSTPEPEPASAASPSPSPPPEPAAEGEPTPRGEGALEDSREAEPLGGLEEPRGVPDGGAGGGDETSFGDVEPERPPLGGFERDGTEPPEPLLAALEQAVEALWEDEEVPAPEPAAGATPLEDPAATAAAGEAPPAPVPEVTPPAEAEPEEPEEPPPELDRTAPPRWSIDDARTALAASTHRDEVVVVALRFARDFFEYAALFAVTRDAVVGHDAMGSSEEARAHCRATAIYADDPGIVRTALETHAPYLGPVSREAQGTSNVLDGLWRGTPRTVLLYPILVGERPVAVLYADNGDAPVSARRLGDLLLFLSTVAAAFERIILTRKRRRRRPAPPPAPPPQAAPPTAPPPAPEPSATWLAPPPGGVAEPPAVGRSEGEWAAQAVSEAAARSDPEERAAHALSAGFAEGAHSGASNPPRSPPEVVVAQAMSSLLSGAPESADRPTAIVDLMLGSDPDIAAAAREALVEHRRDAAVKPLPERLRRALLSGVGDRPVLAARALGAMRDVESIPLLIQALEGSAQEAAAEALAAITFQKLGASPQRWLKWWKENRGRSRAEWLFGALTSKDLEARVAASGELRAAGEPPVRYSPDMATADLEAAARAWWVWWSRNGITL